LAFTTTITTVRTARMAALTITPVLALVLVLVPAKVLAHADVVQKCSMPAPCAMLCCS
jgi:methionine-rich copper-binding protein CopC